MRLLKERALKLRDHKSPSCNKIAIKMRSKLMGFQSLVTALKNIISCEEGILS
jgi:hypothetical protein